MSTEHQQYSPQNQSDTIEKFAEQHEMTIVATYDDHGRSGLNIAGRSGLRQLLTDVESGLTNFTDLLVYDVSRWGRFQDADESAYYEYVLKRAGICIHYCGEQFANDGSMASALMKTLSGPWLGNTVENSLSKSSQVSAVSSSLDFDRAVRPASACADSSSIVMEMIKDC